MLILLYIVHNAGKISEHSRTMGQAAARDRGQPPCGADNMGYRHDIFISYRRHPETLEWIKIHFLPLLTHRVGCEMPDPPQIYVHEITHQIPAGTAWPVELGEEIGASRILIALWTGSYINSIWCAQELFLMLAREQETGSRTPQNKYGLIVPVVVHDGEKIPQELGLAQRLDITTCFNTRMRRDGRKAEQLSDKIAEHARGIAGAIANAPQWQEHWPQQAAQQLVNTYHALEPSQNSVPRFRGQ